jgi:hypothetical protein
MTFKTILIIALLFVGFHLLLYGYVRRRIAAAKHRADQNADLPSGGDDQ